MLQKYYSSQQMSKLVLTHQNKNILFINDQGNGQFQIEARPQMAAVETPILFKLMTNLKQNVILTPTNGILSQGAKGKRTIKVKFTGNDIDMKKARVQIRWISLSSSSQLFPQLESVLIFTDFYRKSSDKYKEQRLEMTLQSSNQHNIQVVQYNLKVAKESNKFKQQQFAAQSASAYMKNEEGEVFYHVFLESKGFLQETINILKKNNIKSLKQLRKWYHNGLAQTQIPIQEIVKLQELISK